MLLYEGCNYYDILFILLENGGGCLIEFVVKCYYLCVSLIDSASTFLDAFMSSSKLIFPLILSLISAFIFWFVFSHYPENKRRKKLRPIIEYDFYCLNQSLFSIFNTVFGSNISFQSEVISGKLTKNDIYIALQNKCINEHYLYDSNVSQHYEVIGIKLADNFRISEKIIDKILTYNEFATAAELLILEKIRQKLKTYEITEKRVENDKLTTVYPPVSNMYYLYQNIYELYELYKIIQNIVYKNDYIDRGTMFQITQYLYYSGKYKECKKYIKNYKPEFGNANEIFSYYDLMCDYKMNKIDYNKVDNVLSRRDHNGGLVYSRSFIKVLIKDNGIKELIEKHYSKSEIEYCLNTIQQEKKKKEDYISTNKKISEYMAKKDTRLKNVNWNN